MLAEARELIVGSGYRATTIGAIAAASGVSVATVYELLGRKPEILRELIETAISGTDQVVAAEDRGYVAAIRAEPDAARKIAIYASAVTEIQQRMAPLFLALRDASSTEPEAQAVWVDIAERRAANMAELAAELERTGKLRSDLTNREVADVLWATNSSELYAMLTGERGWSPARFERWLADTWQRLLLE